MAIEASGYFVWNPDRREPNYRHDTVNSALVEAERLARAHPGQQFIVLKVLGAAIVEKPVAFKWAPGCETMEQEIPF